MGVSCCRFTGLRIFKFVSPTKGISLIPGLARQPESKVLRYNTQQEASTTTESIWMLKLLFLTLRKAGFVQGRKSIARLFCTPLSSVATTCWNLPFDYFEEEEWRSQSFKDEVREADLGKQLHHPDWLCGYRPRRLCGRMQGRANRRENLRCPELPAVGQPGHASTAHP